MFIRSTASISPQASFQELLVNPANYEGDRLTCIEPDYSTYVDVRQIRRMSRIIKMGVAAALQTMKDSGHEKPEAIITGTAYGCLADTEAFLTRLVEFKEELLTPTAFIQSTHNTVAGQIALLLKCHNYNNTFVHRGFSFENALLDALTMAEEGEIKNALVGSVDEIITASHTILKRFGLYRQHGASQTLPDTPARGSMNGEGAAFFFLTNQEDPANLARLDGLETFYKPAEDTIPDRIETFLANHHTRIGEIDLIITGDNGDISNDRIFNSVKKGLFTTNQLMPFKQYCGEYPTASSFALWLATNIISTGEVPSTAGQVKAPKKILIYNHSQRIHHALFLLSAC